MQTRWVSEPVSVFCAPFFLFLCFVLFWCVSFCFIFLFHFSLFYYYPLEAFFFLMKDREGVVSDGRGDGN